MAEEFAVIVNTQPFDWYVSQTYGLYVIRKPEEGQPYSLLPIYTRDRKIDIGEGPKNMVPVPMKPREIALDVARDLADLGVFVCAGERPTAAELYAAKERCNAFYRRKVREGDLEWGRSHRHENIDDNSRRGCIVLGVQREWAYSIDEKDACPFCGELIRKGLAKCPVNGCIVDPLKALQGGLISRQQFEDMKDLRKEKKPETPKAASKRPEPQVQAPV